MILDRCIPLARIVSISLVSIHFGFCAIDSLVTLVAQAAQIPDLWASATSAILALLGRERWPRLARDLRWIDETVLDVYWYREWASSLRWHRKRQRTNRLPDYRWMVNTHESSRDESSRTHAKHIIIKNLTFWLGLDFQDFAPSQGCSLCGQCSSWSKIWFNSSAFWNMACAFGILWRTLAALSSQAMNHCSSLLHWNQPVFACFDRTFLLCAFFCCIWDVTSEIYTKS